MPVLFNCLYKKKLVNADKVFEVVTFLSPNEEHIKSVVFRNKVINIKYLSVASKKSWEINFDQSGREHRTESQE